MRSRLPFLFLVLVSCASASGGLSSESWTIEELGLPTAAQAAASARPLSPGAEREAALVDTDPVFGDTTRYHVWRFDAVPGRRSTIKVSSAAYTPFLVVASPIGDSLEVVGSNKGDDGPARVSFEAVDRGPFYVFVNALRSQDRGEYTLRAGPYEPPFLLIGAIPASDIRPLERSNTAVSTLGRDDRRLHDQSLFQLWRFRGKKGERFTLTMASTDLRPYVGYGRIVRDSLIIEGEGGSSEDGREAAMLVELERDGEHIVIANGVSAQDEGRYTLRLEPRGEMRFRVAPSSVEKAGTLTVGAPQFGTLAAADAVLGDRTHYQLWRFEGKAGESVMVTMSSTELDPYLYVGTLEGDELRVLEFNDDRGVGEEARVRLTLPRSGTYVVVANAVSASELGPYRLRLEKNRGGIRLR